jgi:hypothetical protein
MCFFRESDMARTVSVAVGEILSMKTRNGAKNQLPGEAKAASVEALDQKRDVLGQCLRRIYREVAEEPIPDSIADVLRRLE